MELIAILAAILGVSLRSSQTHTLPYRFLPNPSFYLPAARTILEASSLNPAYSHPYSLIVTTVNYVPISYP